ncbi:hypothetical protein ACTXT7_008094 [Hymenolepis weldensis]
MLYVKIKALDYDHLSSPDMLGEFYFTFGPYEVPSLYPTEKAAISSSWAHPSTNIKDTNVIHIELVIVRKADQKQKPLPSENTKS